MEACTRVDPVLSGHVEPETEETERLENSKHAGSTLKHCCKTSLARSKAALHRPSLFC